ncbi:MAG: putative toxin-antitoxin system toxin component, PIN family [Wenzhouxiangellaceae bacterium]|nr:putative toxin-antitoxin system toxin component, PIN family [Wenzhouxiangellaceae bacterium]
MGPNTLKCVLDTNVVVSALIFSGRRMAWLRRAWASGDMLPLASRATTDELLRVLSYPKFKLAREEQLELLGDYLPYCQIVQIDSDVPELPRCEDPDDQKFLDLASVGQADWLITGDPHLLALAGQTSFAVLKPAEARDRLATRPR